MPLLNRGPAETAGGRFDLIVVGGGIYGVFLALQAARRGLRSLLLERGDFGEQTSFNSLRIIHGGLRYLQSADLPRYRESVRERKWLLSRFGDLVSPMPCMMPLYGEGLRRKSVMRLALFANDLLSASRNDGVPESSQLPAGKILDAEATLRQCPEIRAEGLSGSAVWYDAALDDSQRLIVELLRWGAGLGATALNYMEVTELQHRQGRVSGVVARDAHTAREHSYQAPVVINAAGPWSAQFARLVGAKDSTLFTPSLAWNLWLDRPAPSACALALTARRRKGPTYFLRPWKGRLLLGTGHAPWHGGIDRPYPSTQQIGQMLDDVNSAAPDLQLTANEIRRVFAGFLPARQAGSATLSVRPAQVDHGAVGGPTGFHSVCGIKFTTAHRVANDTLDKVFGAQSRRADSHCCRPPAVTDWRAGSLAFDDKSAQARYLAVLKQIIAEESVHHLSDLVFRRTDLWENPEALDRLCDDIIALFDWDEQRQNAELDRLSRSGVTLKREEPDDPTAHQAHECKRTN